MADVDGEEQTDGESEQQEIEEGKIHRHECCVCALRFGINAAARQWDGAMPSGEDLQSNVLKGRCNLLITHFQKV
jgi:hypothetical protein